MSSLSTDAPARDSARRYAWRTAGIAALIVLAIWLFVAKASPRMPDFEVYWRAGARAAASEPLYRPADADYQFKYFPAFAVLTIPFGAMPLPVAKPIWFGLSALALAMLLPLAARVLPHRRKSTTFLVVALLIGLAKYYAQDLVLGQINTLVVLVAVCALLALKNGREALGGSLVALAVVLKPYVLILVPWIVARRNMKSIAALAAGLALAFVLPVPIYGISGTMALHQEWWRTVSTTTEGTLLDSRNVSLAAMWAKWLGIGPTAAAVAAVSSAILLVASAVVFVRRTTVPHPDGLEAAMLIALTPIVSPQGWDYVLVLATIAMAFVVNDIDRIGRWWRVIALAAIAAIGLTLYDLVGRRMLYALLELSVITIGMIALLASLVALRMRRLA